MFPEQTGKIAAGNMSPLLVARSRTAKSLENENESHLRISEADSCPVFIYVVIDGIDAAGVRPGAHRYNGSFEYQCLLYV